MMKMFFLALFSLFSSLTFADDSVIEYCQISIRESFSIYVNYGDVSPPTLARRGSSHGGGSVDKFDDDVLYLTDKFNGSVIKLWSNDEKDAIFYDASIDDDDDDLNGLHCDTGEPPVVKPPTFKLDICPFVPNTVQTNNVLYDKKPYGSLQVSSNSGNYVKVSDFNDEFFLAHQTGTKNCKFPDDSLGECKTTTEMPVVDFPPTLVWEPKNDGYDKSCEDGQESHCNLAAGTYKNVTIKTGKTLTLQGGVYYFNELKFSEENVALEILGPTEIHYKKIMFEKPNVRINAGVNVRPSEELLIIGHGKEANFSPKNDANDILINAYIYVDHLASSANSGFTISASNNKIIGGVTAHSISISGRSNTIHASNKLNCFGPLTPDIARINIVPNNMYLQCQDDKSVYVEVFDKDNNLITDIGSTRVSLYSKITDALGFTLIGFDTVSGRFEYQISSKAGNDYGPIRVKAHVVGDTSIKDNSDIVFAPVKFNINNGKEKELIAGQSAQIPISVLACSQDDQTITGNYSNTLSKNDLTNESFMPGLWSRNDDKLSFTAQISNGVALANIQFDDAGQYVGRLVDMVSCRDFGPDVKDCPENEIKQIQGELKFKARPWTFAICDSKTQPFLNGNISDKNTPAFLAAGKTFDSQVLPIMWIESATVPVTTKSNYCDAGHVTQNFFLGGGGTFDVALDHQVLDSDMVDGVLSGITSMSYTKKSSAGNYYDFSVLSWNEVGALELLASATSSYLGMTIDPGKTDIGRFYPNHFAVSESTWTAPENQNGITYLSQPFESAEIKVAAFAYGSTEPVKNYRLFASDLQAAFSLKQDSVGDNELVLDVVSGSWQQHAGASYWVLDDDAAKVNRRHLSMLGSTITSKENGPFNIEVSIDPLASATDFGLTISGHDPVSFDQDDTVQTQAFQHQPKLRYGRMVMGSSGGQSGSALTVPLRVEYWNGSRFVVNVDDDRSILNSSNSHVCKQILWSEGAASDSQLSGAASSTRVTDGEYASLEAQADSGDKTVREQVRFWLRLDDTTIAGGHRSPQTALSDVNCGGNGVVQPWLQYNWRDKGDEDPSTVATFGIFRGNDKIIFRGEPGLTGQ